LSTRKQISELTFAQEGCENLVNLSIGDSTTISTLLNYLYTTTYSSQAEDSLITDVNVYLAADFYDIPILKQLAAGRFESLLEAVDAIYTDTPSSDRTLWDPVLNTIVAHAPDLIKSDEDKPPTLYLS